MKIYYSSSLWSKGKGLSGWPQRTNWKFKYAGTKRYIPAIYRFSEIISIILIIWFVFSITDFSLAKVNKTPIFAIPVIRYKDGGSTEYYGLGYKIIKYVNLTIERGPEVVKIDFGTWFMRFSPPQ